jgi:hypothetical protein
MRQDNEKRDPLRDDTEADRFDDALRLLLNTPPKPKKNDTQGRPQKTEKADSQD